MHHNVSQATTYGYHNDATGKADNHNDDHPLLSAVMMNVFTDCSCDIPGEDSICMEYTDSTSATNRCIKKIPVGGPCSAHLQCAFTQHQSLLHQGSVSPKTPSGPSGEAEEIIAVRPLARIRKMSNSPVRRISTFRLLGPFQRDKLDFANRLVKMGIDKTPSHVVRKNRHRFTGVCGINAPMGRQEHFIQEELTDKKSTSTGLLSHTPPATKGTKVREGIHAFLNVQAALPTASDKRLVAHLKYYRNGSLLPSEVLKDMQRIGPREPKWKTYISAKHIHRCVMSGVIPSVRIKPSTFGNRAKAKVDEARGGNLLTFGPILDKDNLLLKPGSHLRYSDVAKKDGITVNANKSNICAMHEDRVTLVTLFDISKNGPTAWEELLRANRGEKLQGCYVWGCGGSPGTAGSNSGDLSLVGSSKLGPTILLPSNQDPTFGSAGVLQKVSQREGVVCLMICDNATEKMKPIDSRTCHYVGPYIVDGFSYDRGMNKQEVVDLSRRVNGIRSSLGMRPLNADEDSRLYAAIARRIVFRLVPLLPDFPLWFANGGSPLSKRVYRFGTIDESEEGSYYLPLTEDDLKDKQCIRPGERGKTVQDVIDSMNPCEFVRASDDTTPHETTPTDLDPCSDGYTSDESDASLVGNPGSELSSHSFNSPFVDATGRESAVNSAAKNARTMLTPKEAISSMVHVSACNAARMLGQTLCQEGANCDISDDRDNDGCGFPPKIHPVRDPTFVTKNCPPTFLNMPCPSSIHDFDATCHIAQISTQSEVSEAVGSDYVEGPAWLLRNIDLAHSTFFKALASVLLSPAAAVDIARTSGNAWKSGGILPPPSQATLLLDAISSNSDNLSSMVNKQFKLPKALYKAPAMSLLIRKMSGMEGRSLVEEALMTASIGSASGLDSREAARCLIQERFMTWISGLVVSKFVSHVILRQFETIWRLPFGRVYKVWPGNGATNASGRLWKPSDCMDTDTAVDWETRRYKVVENPVADGGNNSPMCMSSHSDEAIQWIYDEVIAMKDDATFLASLGLEVYKEEICIIDFYGTGVHKPFTKSHAENFLCKVSRLLSFVTPTRNVSKQRDMHNSYCHPIYLDDETDRCSPWMNPLRECSSVLLKHFEQLQIFDSSLTPLGHQFDFA